MKKRRKREPTSHHHRRCKSHGGGTNSANISKVSPHKHRAWHLLFGNMKSHDIAEYISSVWLDPKYRLVVEEVERKTAR